MSYDYQDIRDGIKTLENQEQADLLAQAKIDSDARRAQALLFIQNNIIITNNTSLSISAQKTQCYTNMEYLTAQIKIAITGELKEELRKLVDIQYAKSIILKDQQRALKIG